MAVVKILVEGYARQKKGYFEATCSTVLVEADGKKILVDPGCNEALLLDALKKEGLSQKDIDYIFITHYHVDHWLNVRLFLHVDVLDGNTIYRGDKEISFSGVLPGTNIEVVSTPGHAYEETTLFVSTKEGIVAIAEDLFWWEDGLQKNDYNSLLNNEDQFMKNKEQLLASRKLVLKKADFVIPGHGKMFKVLKNKVMHY
ncbi:MAG: MBL fold metallo-hydrolase [Candidatus Diapherotrites archaeon]|nr:MBL fold metallo-hydrolase [Candidatus Diapherotrites archaeon]